MTQELRFIAEPELRAAANGRTLTGYAATFNSWSEDLGGFKEKIAPGAFRNALREQQDVRALVNHDADKVLGRTRSGTLKLAEDSRGLHFELKVGNTSYAKDILECVSRGDVSQCSFAFSLRKGGDEWDYGTARTRTLKDVNLKDVSVVTYPAYQATSVQARAAMGADFKSVGLYRQAPIRTYTYAPLAGEEEIERLRQRLRLRQQAGL